jgi:hypothetical protein
MAVSCFRLRFGSNSGNRPRLDFFQIPTGRVVEVGTQVAVST